ncbi:MAG TPA: hypothetical protein ENI23_15950 [bacterium]|nr:hypothetical protein [bacterium]
MSWSINFKAATAENARKRIHEHPNLPHEIRDYILAGLAHLEDDRPVFVEGFGHLYDGNSHQHTEAKISVLPITYDKPRE